MPTGKTHTSKQSAFLVDLGIPLLIIRDLQLIIANGILDALDDHLAALLVRILRSLA